MLGGTGINPIDAQEFADIPISIDGVIVGVLLPEMTEPNWIKISLRSRNGFNVNNIANKFGGGGHKYAAGCEIQGYHYRSTASHPRRIGESPVINSNSNIEPETNSNFYSIVYR